MKIVRGKISEATTAELYKYWLEQDWCEIYDFNDYMKRCEKHGTVITDKIQEAQDDRD